MTVRPAACALRKVWAASQSPALPARRGDAMEGRLACFTQEQRQRLTAARVGIAGTGGLGSNAAMMLARSGVGSLILIDCDIVEASNLNRQHFMPRHLGRPKAEALAEQIRELDASIAVDVRVLRLDASNTPALLPLADIWVEAMDDARTKALFTALALRSGRPVIAASGMGGYGGRPMRRRVLGGSGEGLPTGSPERAVPRAFAAVVGDFHADIASHPPLAPRVIQCAAMQADAVLEWLFTGKVEPLL